MTVTSRIPALIDYLVNLFSAAATLGQATPPVTVLDGPAVTDLDPPLLLYVGLTDPDSDGPEMAADSTQTWAALGRQAREEVTTIHCCAEAWYGSDDMRSARLGATGIVAAVEVLMAADSTQFGGNVVYPAPGLSVQGLLQNSTNKGAMARVPFDLTFTSRIG